MSEKNQPLFKLILADDEALIRRGLSLIRWEDMGFQLEETFADGGEIIEYLQHNHADVVLTDIVMPHVSGIEVAKWIFENKPETKVVILSGYAEFSDAQKAIEYHVARYLLKPTDRDELFKQFVSIHQELAARNTAPLPDEDDLADVDESDLQQKVDLYIEKHLQDGASLAGAAEFVYMSPAYLSRAFKDETGENYSDYVARKRMDEAKRLLRESNLQIQEICHRIGYADVRYFTRVFRETTGDTPSHFRKKSVRDEK